MAIQTIHALDNVSVAAGGTENSNWFTGYLVEALRAVIDSAGANITVDIEGSPDQGNTVYTIASGVTGSDQVRDVSDRWVRLSATNGGTGAESVDAWLMVRESR